MNKSRYALLTIVAGLLGLSMAVPAVFAKEGTDKTMEQRIDNGEAAVKDAWIHGKLESALLFNEHINSFDIDSDVQNGVAYLRGAVESDIDRDLAGEIAKSIDGVTDVENDLVVDKAKVAQSMQTEQSQKRQGFKQHVLNATLTAKVKTQLLVNGNTTGTAINVDSDNGVVTLSGVVDSDEEKELAERIASNTSGTKSVNDRLTVESEEEAE